MTMTPRRPSYANHLLKSLPAECLSRLSPHLKLEPVKEGTVLYDSRDRLDYAYFPEHNALLSFITANEEGDMVEVALCGSEGFAGYAALLGQDESPHQVLAQLSGNCYNIKVKHLLQ